MREPTHLREVKLVTIGSSRTIPLPEALLKKYGWTDTLILEETEEGVFLRGWASGKLSWTETCRAMAAAQEDWSDMDVTVVEGLD